ncbi:hypothetical protein GDO81_006788 [Engystomops pustulosus]|uniref:Uncharacterized protein n=1 Tax=Engystomops pustulosus TaxID=76066 RepID=A0AAV7CZF9_ENGPU|nr:hypothetical protein GDO81_006788 [Engystomops pustulosus]
MNCTILLCIRHDHKKGSSLNSRKITWLSKCIIRKHAFFLDLIFQLHFSLLQVAPADTPMTSGSCEITTRSICTLYDICMVCVTLVAVIYISK